MCPAYAALMEKDKDLPEYKEMEAKYKVRSFAGRGRTLVLLVVAAAVVVVVVYYYCYYYYYYYYYYYIIIIT